MKRLLATAMVAAFALTAVAGDAEAQRRRSRTEVITTAPSIDPLTLMLLLGGGGIGQAGLAYGGGGLGIAPLLLPQLLAPPQTVIIEERGGRRGDRRRVRERAPALRRN